MGDEDDDKREAGKRVNRCRFALEVLFVLWLACIAAAFLGGFGVIDLQPDFCIAIAGAFYIGMVVVLAVAP